MKSFLYRHFARRIWFVPLVLIWGYMCLKQVNSANGYKVIAFIKAYEMSLLVPAFILTVSMFGNKAEIEFCRCYGFGLPKLCIAQVGPYYVYSAICMALLLLVFPLKDMGLTGELIVITYFSFLLNLTVAVALAVLVRVLTRNMFGCIGFEMIALFLLSAGKGEGWNYFVELEAFGNMIYKKYGWEMLLLNRAIYVVIGIASAIGAYLIMKSKNYMEGE